MSNLVLCNNCGQSVQEQDINEFGNCIYCSPVRSLKFSQEFLSEIKSLALQIAFRQRGEHHMQDVPTLTRKFDVEMQELADAREQWDELPDICYYAACLVIVRDETATHHFVREYDDVSYSDEYQQAEEYAKEQQDSREAADKALSLLFREMAERAVTVSQIEAGTLAKYRLRVDAKDVDAERKDVFLAVDPVKHGKKMRQSISVASPADLGAIATEIVAAFQGEGARRGVNFRNACPYWVSGPSGWRGHKVYYCADHEGTSRLTRNIDQVLRQEFEVVEVTPGYVAQFIAYEVRAALTSAD